MAPDRYAAKDILTLPEAARLLRISPRTAQRMANEGRFPGDAAVRVGQRWLVSVPKLIRYLHGDSVL